MQQLEPQILNKIVQQISELYVRNESPHLLIERYQGKIPLSDFICFTYGTRCQQPGRVIEVLYFLAKTQIGNQMPYQVALWDQTTLTYHTFWVENTGVLRNDFLRFTKKTHLFRNTFLFDPQTESIYRLHELKPYLHLPFVFLKDEVIWVSDKTSIYGTTCMIKQETSVVSKHNKYKQILNLCDELNQLINSCHYL